MRRAIFIAVFSAILGQQAQSNPPRYTLTFDLNGGPETVTPYRLQQLVEKSTCILSIDGEEFVVERFIGAGNFGAVFRAQNSKGQTIALKLPLFKEGNGFAALKAQAQALATLRKKGFKTPSARLGPNAKFMEMSLVQGENLSVWMAEPKIPGSMDSETLRFVDFIYQFEKRGISIPPENNLGFNIMRDIHGDFVVVDPGTAWDLMWQEVPFGLFIEDKLRPTPSGGWPYQLRYGVDVNLLVFQRRVRDGTVRPKLPLPESVFLADGSPHPFWAVEFFVNVESENFAELMSQSVQWNALNNDARTLASHRLFEGDQFKRLLAPEKWKHRQHVHFEHLVQHPLFSAFDHPVIGRALTEMPRVSAKKFLDTYRPRLPAHILNAPVARWARGEPVSDWSAGFALSKAHDPEADWQHWRDMGGSTKIQKPGFLNCVTTLIRTARSKFFKSREP